MLARLIHNHLNNFAIALPISADDFYVDMISANSRACRTSVDRRLQAATPFAA
jgi:hypothetical protein